MGELLTNNVKSKYYPLNAIDIQMKPKKLYTLPSVVTSSSINHLVDGLVKRKNLQEPYSHATSDYLLISQHGCQTTWHQDFSGTSVLYFLLIGEKTFFLVAPTEKNKELFKKWEEQVVEFDLYYAIFKERIKDMKLNLTDPNWNGAYVATSK